MIKNFASFQKHLNTNNCTVTSQSVPYGPNFPNENYLLVKSNTNPYLQVKIFPYQNCCGAICMQGLAFTSNQPQKEVTDFMDIILKHFLNDGNNFVNYITASHQSKLPPVLEALEFQKIFTFVNKNSSNTCYLWVIDLTKKSFK